MDIIGNQHNKNNVQKPEMERLEKEKQEYKLIGKYLRRRGLKLFSYNPLKDKLKEVKTENKGTLEISVDKEGKGVYEDNISEKANVDTRHIHFEALNWKNANKRLKKYKGGKIKDLCNLREIGTFDLW